MDSRVARPVMSARGNCDDTETGTGKRGGGGGGKSESPRLGKREEGEKEKKGRRRRCGIAARGKCSEHRPSPITSAASALEKRKKNVRAGSTERKKEKEAPGKTA